MKKDKKKHPKHLAERLAKKVLNNIARRKQIKPVLPLNVIIKPHSMKNP